MTHNPSLESSILFKEQMQLNLLPAFKAFFPMEEIKSFMVNKYEKTDIRKRPRDKVYTVENTLFAWTLSATQEDKSLQQTVNLFKQVYEKQSQSLQAEELKQLEAEKETDKKTERRMGRPKLYKSKMLKSITNELSSSPVAYCNARARLPMELVESVFACSANFGKLPQESWHGMNTYITDGTYIQLQDTEEIRSEFPPMEGEGMFPQALLQVFIRQGSGQITQCTMGSRKESELQLVIPMIKKLKENDLLLADDLYNSYYHFCLILEQKADIIVPGKRVRNYIVKKTLANGDEIVKIKKGHRPDYVTVEEWQKLPNSIRLRRISYSYPTKEGVKNAVIYSTILDETISSADIVLKYTIRWDIEISIRETKTLMDINVLRGKSLDIQKKELLVTLTAYNMVRRITAQSAEKAGFSPQKDIFQKCAEISRPLLLDKRGRVFHRWSPGRYGKTVSSNN
jgi:hypothetical protein